MKKIAITLLSLTLSCIVNAQIVSISSVTTQDGNGSPVSVGATVSITGTVHGVNLRASSTGLSFTVIDNTDGISCFTSPNTYGYTVTEGDSVVLIGDIGEFNGLTQIYLDTIIYISGGHTLDNPWITRVLDETQESRITKIKYLTIPTPSQWTGTGSGFTVDVTDGVNTYDMRIDNDVDLYSMSAPTGTFHLTGIGGQYDVTSPYFDFYQLLPRYSADIQSIPFYDISVVTNEDGNGEPDLMGTACMLGGIVYGVNTRASETGVSFTIRDNTGGIVCYNGGKTFGYNVTEGDSVVVGGEIIHYNGLTELYLDTIFPVINTGNTLKNASSVTAIDETTESDLIKINNVSLVTPSQWTGTGTGFNVDLTDGTNNYIARIDNDCSLFSTAAPTGTFNLTGLGSQFDVTSPYTDFYQIYPRYTADLVNVTTTIPNYNISTVSTVDANGVPDSMNVTCALTGVVHGVNMEASQSSLLFTIIDGTGGIACYKNGTTLGYSVAEGDLVTVYGDIGHFNGLTQINLDSISLLNTGNTLQTPTVVTALNESTESNIIILNNLTLVTPSQWTGTGNGFLVDVTDGTNTYQAWIDEDCSLFSTTAPSGAFDLTGIGSQFDVTSPYTSFYQINPRYIADLAMIAGANDPIPDNSTLATVTGECNVTVTTVPTATSQLNGSTINGTTSDPLTYTSLGTFNIAWVYVDGNGNSTTQNQTVIVSDGTDPIPDVTNLGDITGGCAVNLNTTPTATDNCAGSITGTTSDPMSYNTIGNYTITWSYDDGNGNVVTQNQNVIVTNNVDVSVTLNNTTAQVAETGASYQWVDCNNSFVGIANATNQSFTPSATGNYAVVVTNGSCIDTSICVNIKIGGTVDGINILNSIGFKLYPNPTEDVLYLTSKSMSENIQVNVYDLTGKKQIIKSNLSNIGQVDVSNLENGTYILELSDGKENLFQRFIKQ